MKSLAALLLCLVFAACQKQPFEYVPRESDGTGKLNYQVGTNKADILMIMDSSQSMVDKNESVARNAKTFIDSLVNTGIDFQLAVTSTNVTYRPADPSDPVAIAGSLMLVAVEPNAYFIAAKGQSGDAYRAQLAAQLNNAVQTVIGLNRKFESAIDRNVGYFNSHEAGLAAAWAALRPDPEPEVLAQRAGFLRDDADLILLFITDEDDCSAADQNRFFADTNALRSNLTCYRDLPTSLPAEDRLRDPSEFVTQFLSLKNNDAQRLRAAIVGGLMPAGVQDANKPITPGACYIDSPTGSPNYNCGCWRSMVGAGGGNDQTGDQTRNYFCNYVGTHDPDKTCGINPDTCSNSTDANTTQCFSDKKQQCVLTCQALPAPRYAQFLNALGDKQLSINGKAGIFAQSICDGNFGSTLASIAQNVISNGCFFFSVQVTDPSSLRVYREEADADGKIVRRTDLPFFDASGANGACSSCDKCPSGAFTFTAPNQVCAVCEPTPNEAITRRYAIEFKS